MKAILKNYRYYVLAVLLIVAMTGIFAVPADELPPSNWFYTLISSKAIGFSAGYAIARLTKRWERLGTIPELINAINNY